MRNIYQFEEKSLSGDLIPDGMSCINESQNIDIEKKFTSSLAEFLCDKLQIPHMERRITQTLFFDILSQELNDRQKPGLLQQYRAYILDKAAERLIETFDLGENIKIDHDNALHAKYATIAKTIKENIVGKAPKCIPELSIFVGKTNNGERYVASIYKKGECIIEPAQLMDFDGPGGAYENAIKYIAKYPKKFTTVKK